VNAVAADSAAAETVIEIRGLCKRYGRQQVHKGLDLEVRRG
jgi:ABC-type transporter Mla maintaining outer membrane lipid asymmetry ATPase subunit MlaF